MNVRAKIISEEVVLCENILNCLAKIDVQFLSQDAILLTQFCVFKLRVSERGFKLVKSE